LERNMPSLEDYLATAALANVPFWIYLLLLTFDVNRYSQSNLLFFFTVLPIVAIAGGGFVASYLLCTRSRRGFLRIGFLVGVCATLINIVFGLATSAPSAIVVTAFCFLGSSVIAAKIRDRKKMLER